jgi:hypothetical protein
MQPIDQFVELTLEGQWWRSDGASVLEEFDSTPQNGNLSEVQALVLNQSDRDLMGGTDYDHSLRGALTFTPGSGISLSLLGTSEIAFPVGGEPFVIYGETTKGEPCSLLGCWVSNATSQLFGVGVSRREIHVSKAIVGMHLGSEAELRFDHLEVRLSDLVSFLWAPVHDERGTPIGGMGHGPKESETHSIDADGVNIEFSLGSRMTNSTHASTWERDALVSIRLENEINWREWKENWVQPLSRLITLATGRPSSVVSTSAIFTEQIPPGPISPTGTTRPRAVHIFEPQTIFDTSKELDWNRLLFSFASLGDCFDAFVLEWIGLNEQLAGTSDFLFGALAPGQNIQTQLVTLASVIESYHRAFHQGESIPSKTHSKIVEEMCDAIDDEDFRKHYRRRLKYANELTQQDRVRATIKRASSVLKPLGTKTGRLAEAIVATRNYFVHLGEKNDRVLPVEEIWEANFILTLAIKSNLLLDLGVPAAEIQSGVIRANGGHPVLNALLKRGSAWPKKKPKRKLKDSGGD